MKLLELFSGTKSISKVFNKYNWDTLSVDNDKQQNPDICIDINDFDYKKYPVGYFDYIHASPPCVSYSTMGGGKHRTKSDLSPKTDTAIMGDLLLNKTCEILDYLKPTYWTIENPRGLMRYCLERPYTTVNYCRYGSQFFKPTDIFNNFNYVGRKCQYERAGKVVDCHHDRMAGSHGNRARSGIQRVSQNDRYAIPEGLVEDIYKSITL